MHSRADSDWFRPPVPRVIAHRGLTVGAPGQPDAPENTLLAFRRALDAGATHLETDVRATADGRAVLIHDPDLVRLTGSSTAVEEATLEELQRVALPVDQRICTLQDALREFPSALFNIDVKAAAAIRPVAADIRAADAGRRVLVTSFSGRRRRAVLRMVPGAATSASSGVALAALLAARVGAVPIARLALRRVDAVQIPTRYGPFSLTSPSMIRRLRSADVEVHYWTIDDPATMRDLVAAGADGIVTDRADLAVASL